jgi:hypothetical protein
MAPGARRTTAPLSPPLPDARAVPQAAIAGPLSIAVTWTREPAGLT